MRVSTTSTFPADRCPHRIVVRSVVNVVMPSADDSVTYDAMVASAAVMVLLTTGGHGASRRLSRPLVASVRIVKQRVLMRLRIRVKVVVDLGLQLVGDSRRGCGCCCR